MKKEKMSFQNNGFLTCIAAVAVAAALYFFLPLQYTVYSQPNDGNLSSPDAISTQTPLQQCIDGDFQNVTELELLLATYGRINTNSEHFEIFSLLDGKRKIIYQTDFSSASVKDNDFFSLRFPAISSTQKFCFLLTSQDALPQNSITYWMNSQSQPVLKLKSSVSLGEAIKRVAAASRFRLPIRLAIALCWGYLLANVGVLFLIWHEKAPSPHPRRARQKRV